VGHCSTFRCIVPSVNRARPVTRRFAAGAASVRRALRRCRAMRGRPLLVQAFVVLAALALAISALALYADRVLFDSEGFADRVEVALSEQAVAREVGGTLTDEIVHARPDLIAVEPLVRSVAEQVVRSAPFRSLAGR